jgi:rare lipoprotein A
MRRASWRLAVSCGVLSLGTLTMGCTSEPGVRRSIAVLRPPVMQHHQAARPASEVPDPLPADTDTDQVGEASYYAARFAGRRTAAGTRFDQERAMVAHRTLPFGTVVRIVNLENGRSEIGTVEDRGPYSRGRIIDLSRSLAQRLDMIRSGVARVRVTVQRQS